MVKPIDIIAAFVDQAVKKEEPIGLKETIAVWTALNDVLKQINELEAKVSEYTPAGVPSHKPNVDQS